MFAKHLLENSSFFVLFCRGEALLAIKAAAVMRNCFSRLILAAIRNRRAAKKILWKCVMGWIANAMVEFKRIKFRNKGKYRRRRDSNRWRPRVSVYALCIYSKYNGKRQPHNIARNVTHAIQ